MLVALVLAFTAFHVLLLANDDIGGVLGWAGR